MYVIVHKEYLQEKESKEPSKLFRQKGPSMRTHTRSFGLGSFSILKHDCVLFESVLYIFHSRAMLTNGSNRKRPVCSFKLHVCSFSVTLKRYVKRYYLYLTKNMSVVPVRDYLSTYSP
jgi:hypothetical protein